jgi:hypothetical protein
VNCGSTDQLMDVAEIGATDGFTPGNRDPISRKMNIDLSDEEPAVLTRELADIVENARYPLSHRIRTLKAILGKLRPEPGREPLPPPPEVYVWRHERRPLEGAAARRR